MRICMRALASERESSTIPVRDAPVLQMFAGMLFFAVVVRFVPSSEGHGHSHGGGGAGGDAGGVSAKRLMTTGIIAAIGISLHNLPEGLVVYNAAITGVCKPGAVNWAGSFSSIVQDHLKHCISRGVVVTWAIALHNIPGRAALHCMHASM